LLSTDNISTFDKNILLNLVESATLVDLSLDEPEGVEGLGGKGGGE